MLERRSPFQINLSLRICMINKATKEATVIASNNFILNSLID